MAPSITEGKQIPVAESAIRSATLSNLCQAVSVGPVILLLRAGRSSGNPVSASNLIVDASSLSGNASFHNIATAGTFTLPGLSLNISTNGGSCP